MLFQVTLLGRTRQLQNGGAKGLQIQHNSQTSPETNTLYNMSPLHAPPTKILSSTPLSTAQAHTFLAAFTAAAEVSKNDVHNGHNEIVFTNLKRIEQALIGIHVPRPTQGELDIEGFTDMTAPIVEQVVPVEGEGEDREGEGREEIGGVDALGEEGVSVHTSVGRVDRKAGKKARRKEEKRQRAEKRQKEKEGDVEDDSE